MSRMLKKGLVVSVAVSAVSGFSVPALAQVDEIIVTARKKSESLQDTPIAVIAVSGADLEQQNIADLEQMQIKIPNISIGGSGGLGGSNAAFFVRGIGTARNAVSQETTTALYIDDEYYGRTDAALLSVLDVERIEVLRGPQGTLFGRGAVAGAIRYVTKKPTDEFEGQIQATIGSNNRYDLKGVLNAPISDNAAIRLTAATLNQDGHVDGVLVDKDFGDVGAILLRGQLKADLSDRFNALLSVDYTSNDTNGGAAVPIQVFSSAPFFAAEAGAVGGPFATANPPVGEFGNSYQTGDNFYKSDNFGGSATLTYNLSDAVDLKSVTSYRTLDIEGAYDGDGTNFDIFEQNYVRDVETFSQEFQVSGQTDSLDWVAGLFYYSEEASDVREVGLTSNAGPNRTGTRIVNPYTVDSYAAFGQGTYRFNDQWSATIGLRFTQDDKSIVADELRGNGVSRLVGLADPNDPTRSLTDGEGVSNDASFSAPSGRLSLEYKASDDVFIFGSYARGYRSGGFNDRIRTDIGAADFYGITTYDEETLDMYELGLRSEFADNRIRFNVTGFFGQYHDMQIAAALPGSARLRTVVQNIGEGEIKGIEGEFVFAPTDNFSIDGSFGILDAEYTELNPAAQIPAVTLDSDFGRAPKLSFAVGAEYQWDAITLRADYGWKDDFRLLVPDAAGIDQDAYGLLSGSVSYAPDNANWSVSVFGTNLTDEEYAVSGLRVANPLGFAAIEPGRFREYGVKLKYDF